MKQSASILLSITGNELTRAVTAVGIRDDRVHSLIALVHDSELVCARGGGASKVIETTCHRALIIIDGSLTRPLTT